MSFLKFIAHIFEISLIIFGVPSVFEAQLCLSATLATIRCNESRLTTTFSDPLEIQIGRSAVHKYGNQNDVTCLFKLACNTGDSKVNDTVIVNCLLIFYSDEFVILCQLFDI